MGRPKGWAASQTGRPVERSPGRPPVGRREHRVRFWAAVAGGATSVDAAVEAGVSEAVGVRWFREGGGMSSVTLAPLSGRYVSFAEREEIALLRAQKGRIKARSGHKIAIGAVKHAILIALYHMLNTGEPLYKPPTPNPGSRTQSPRTRHQTPPRPAREAWALRHAPNGNGSGGGRTLNGGRGASVFS
jgi:hypothetical protein